MSRIEDDDRASADLVGRRQAIGLDQRHLVGLGARGCGPDEFGAEGLGGRLGEVDHQPRRLAVRGWQHEGALDRHRLADVEDDARAAPREKPVAPARDEAAPGQSGVGGRSELDLRQIEDDAIGIGKGERADLDLLAEIEDEARLFLVAGDARIACPRHRRTGRVEGRPQCRDGVRPRARRIGGSARSATKARARQR